ncbi:TetR family transcriptional regulator [Paracoccus shanxieyensis]|uniref:TetR family transcriptional regulator n=1 Tax=Paracoccus shanxieyensis TaxID=2675752 RepID=A0A6L6J197_9RHOB|nr:TetR family transcriptional regulator [Paracoccus shanxieyensis]MTH65192.1 TetR family transcriptional regulator [Paracoccus shanxieyensis]MTH88336.1 TetR family transcriptional regulator [Paracoccus shanxieyensis]
MGSELPQPAAALQVPDRLIRAATRDFLRHGFQGASISRIVQDAGCNVRMIYHYFGSKQGLYRACLTRAYDHLRQAEAEAGFWDLPPPQAMAGLVRFTFDYMQAHPEFLGLVRIENMADGTQVGDMAVVHDRARQLFAAIDRVMARGLRAGDFGAECDPGLLYLTIIGLCTVHLTNRHTMGAVLGRDLTDPDFLHARREDIVGIVLTRLRAGQA